MKKILIFGAILLFLFLLAFHGVYKYSNKDAIEYVTENKANQSRSMCAWYVMKAIRYGGCYNCYIYPAYAYNKILPQLGFEEVPVLNYIPQKGDISVLPQNSASDFGHIAIFNGKKWISDFEQADIFPEKSYRNVGKYQIFRIEDGWHWAHLQFNINDIPKYIKSFSSGYKKIKW